MRIRRLLPFLYGVFGTENMRELSHEGRLMVYYINTTLAPSLSCSFLLFLLKLFFSYSNSPIQPFSLLQFSNFSSTHSPSLSPNMSILTPLQRFVTGTKLDLISILTQTPTAPPWPPHSPAYYGLSLDKFPLEDDEAATKSLVGSLILEEREEENWRC